MSPASFNKRAIALLTKLEWTCDRDSGGTGHQCPECAAFRDGKKHNRGCELASLLREKTKLIVKEAKKRVREQNEPQRTDHASPE